MALITVSALAAELKLDQAEVLRRLKAAGFAARSGQAKVERAAGLSVLQAVDAAVREPGKARGKRRTAHTVEPGTIVIKKYGNRRLYSTEESRYLTLDELEALVRAGRRVLVVDADSDADLTSQVLTQILLEGGRAARLPVRFLEQLVRLGDDALQNLFSRYLLGGLDLFLDAQRQIGQQYQAGLAGLGWPASLLQQAQVPWLNVPFYGGQSPTTAPPLRPVGGEGAEGSEMARMRRRLEELEQQLGSPDQGSRAAEKGKRGRAVRR